MKVTAVFDIGKTNKKFFLFDQNFQEVFKEYSRFEEIRDDDGFPADNLPEIRGWLNGLFSRILESKKFKVQAINFSTYGASFVHIDHRGNPVAPLYNYLKEFPEDLLREFYDKYGGKETFAADTATPPLGMLNSGLQLYFIKYAKPALFEKIRWSLHLPQYISYLFSGIPLSDYTSIGCHTGLWDFKKGDYHHWVYAEGIDRMLPPIASTATSIHMNYEGRRMNIGIGIHDSSAALLPYLKADKKPFLLISTGTWSISLNPFGNKILTEEDLKNDCLNYMRIDGKPVKSARLFLGNEYKLQVRKLETHFKKEHGAHRQTNFDEEIYRRLQEKKGRYFRFESIQLPIAQVEVTDLSPFPTFAEAYHQLMLELTDLQVRAAERAMGNQKINKIYIDGGFADNDIFVKLLSTHFSDYKLRTTRSPLGSALGAAMVISDKEISPKFLKKHYAMDKHLPLILE